MAIKLPKMSKKNVKTLVYAFVGLALVGATCYVVCKMLHREGFFGGSPLDYSGAPVNFGGNAVWANAPDDSEEREFSDFIQAMRDRRGRMADMKRENRGAGMNAGRKMGKKFQ